MDNDRETIMTSGHLSFMRDEDDVTVIECDDIEGEVIIPRTICSEKYGTIYKVTGIDTCAFMDHIDITSVEIPDSVTSIGEGAFRGCLNLCSVNIPHDVIHIGGWAFSQCRNLKEIHLPKDMTSLEEGTFAGCNRLSSISIPENVESIGEDAFNGCSGIVSVSIPEGVTSIGDTAFSRCTRLERVSIPKSVTSIGRGAFNSCPNLRNIDVDADNMNYSSKDGMLLSKDGTVLYRCLMYEVEEFSIPSGIVSIEDYAFLDCKMLRVVNIPDSVKHVGENAFYGCPIV